MHSIDFSTIKDVVDNLFDTLSDSRHQDAGFSWSQFPSLSHELVLNVMVSEDAATRAREYANNKLLRERLPGHDPRTLYSMGFVLSENGSSILLLEKGRPEFLKGKWVGIGGHVDDGENFEQAMARECFEEAGLNISEASWVLLKMVERHDAVIAMFTARHDVSLARTKTDEQVKVFSWAEVEQLPLSDGTQEVMDLVRSLALDMRSSCMKMKV